MAENETTGAIWNIIPVVVLNTLPFLSNTAISLTGCNIPGPVLPEAILFVLRIIPGKKNAVKIISNNPGIFRSALNMSVKI